MEVEENRSLPFLDVLVSRRPDGSLGHTVHRKPTHTELYLHEKSEHHPAQKKAVLTTPVQRARTICDADSLGAEINHLKKHSGKMVIAIVTSSRPPSQQEKPTGVAKLPYQVPSQTRSAGC
jgi:hypothetical protein